MSNWNQLEQRLHSWTPRPASPSVKARLFGEPLGHGSGASADLNARPAAWHWLAPAMAVFLLGMFVVGRNPAGLSDGSTTPWAVSAIGQPQLAAYSSATHHSDANSPPATTIESIFGSTNDGYSPKAPPPMGQTNSLMQ